MFQMWTARLTAQYAAYVGEKSVRRVMLSCSLQYLYQQRYSREKIQGFFRGVPLMVDENGSTVETSFLA